MFPAACYFFDGFRKCRAKAINRCEYPKCSLCKTKAQYDADIEAADRLNRAKGIEPRMTKGGAVRW